jgi:Domain of unknown function (DUF4365)
MSVPESELTSREGVHFIGFQTSRELRWLFREVSSSDIGIDAQIEIIESSRSMGLLVAAQIKSGPSYFREPTGQGFVYREDHRRHLEYWSTHVLPVVVILYEPQVEKAYWQVITDETVEITGVGWKTVVPRNQEYDSAARDPLIDIANRRFEILEKTRRAAQQRLIDRAFEYALGEGRLLLEVRQWVNKSSGRGDIRVISEEPDGTEKTVQDWGTILFGSHDYRELLPRLFPWADLSNDENFYIGDEEEAAAWPIGAADSDLRPYSEDGEIAYWRLELRPNAITLAHRLVTTLPEGDPMRQRWFELLEQAEMSHQAESLLKTEAESVIGRFGSPGL